MPDGRVLVVGGLDGAYEHQVPDSDLYNPTTGTFPSTSPLGTARAGHTATLLLDGRVLGIGDGAASGRTPAFNTAEPFE
jgi:Galactose oxidase, central domain